MNVNRYAERDAVLIQIGFASYADYLKSPLWKRIRSRCLKKNDGQCMLCGRDASEVHHKNYSRAVLLGKDGSGIIPICRDCHTLAEFDTQGFKTSLDEANRRIGLFGSSLANSQETQAERRSRLISNSRCYKKPNRPSSKKPKKIKSDPVLKVAADGWCKKCAIRKLAHPFLWCHKCLVSELTRQGVTGIASRRVIMLARFKRASAEVSRLPIAAIPQEMQPIGMPSRTSPGEVPEGFGSAGTPAVRKARLKAGCDRPTDTRMQG